MGLSGKIRIQIRPPRLMCRVIARRAASIWRAVRRPRPTAFSPYSPKLTLAPTVATPLLRPFCSLRYCLLAGCSICNSRRLARPLRCFGCRHGGRKRLRVVRHHFALEHPDLDPDDAIGRLRFRETVVDIRAQRVKRHPSLAIPLAARDFDAVQPPRAHDLDALRAKAHRVLHRALHGAAEHDALLELLRDRVGDELRIDLGLADLLDIEPDFGAHHLAQISAQRFDVLALLADDHAGARAVNGYACVLGRAFDRDLAHRGVRELLLEIRADLDVLVQYRREVLAVGVPLRCPVAIDGQTEADRMYLLSHDLVLFSVTDGDMDVASLFEYHVATSLGARCKAAQIGRLVEIDRLDLELVDIGTFVVLGVGDCRLQHLLDDLGALLGAERQHVERLVDGQTADMIAAEPALLGRQAHAAQDCFGFHRSLLTSEAAAAPRPSCRRSAP